MIEVLRQSLLSQFEAALCMLQQCLAACPSEHWEGKVANDSFQQVAYHTLFFTDFYLSSGEEAFRLHQLHERGGDERGETLSPGLERTDAIEYVGICRQKVREALARETEATLAGPSGFTRRACTRTELYLYNLRHLQHHTGQLSAYLRRVDESSRDPRSLPWVGHGWR